MGLSAFFQSSLISNTLTASSSFNPNSILGLKLELQPSGLVVSGNRITGWLNKATEQVLVADGLYTANDATFNNLATMKLEGINGTYSYMAGVNLGTVIDGITIIMVTKVVPTTTSDMMWWFIDSVNGPLDLWNLNNNTMVLNTFNGTAFGIVGCIPPTTDTQIITNTIPNGDIYGSKFYINGDFKPMNVNSQGHTQTNLSNAIFYPGYVSFSPNYSFDGKYSTVLVYNRILDASELNTVHAALKTQYAL